MTPTRSEIEEQLADLQWSIRAYAKVESSRQRRVNILSLRACEHDVHDIAQLARRLGRGCRGPLEDGRGGLMPEAASRTVWNVEVRVPALLTPLGPEPRGCNSTVSG